MADDKMTTTTPDPAALEPIPEDLVRDAGRGTEKIGEEDVRPPRLLICQAGSPQRKPDDPKQIKGLQELDLFNDLSGDIYGRGPLPFIVIASLGHKHIEFNDFDQGGGVKDFDVPDGDPRTQFTVNPDGTRTKPLATKFYDYLVWLPEHYEICVLSMKSTQIKTAVKLNGLMKLPLRIGARIVKDPPAWARTYAVATKMEKDSNYSWGGFNLSQVGVTPLEVRDLCRSLADSYGSKSIIIEREDDAINAETVSEAEAEPVTAGREKPPF